MVVVPVFSAGEDPLPDFDGARFAEVLSERHPSVSYLADLDQLADHLLEVTTKGDLVMGLGAGSIGAQTKQVYQSWKA